MRSSATPPMSRSRKKNPITGITCAETDKPFKQKEHRRERRNTRTVLSTTADDTDARLHRSPLYGDPWSSPKDGKQYWNNPKARRK